jgi:phage pi2 protein 07
MSAPEFFAKAEDTLNRVNRKGVFEDIETVYDDLVPYKSVLGGWLTLKTDKPGVDMRSYFEDERQAQQAIRSGSGRPVFSTWLKTEMLPTDLLLAVRKEIEDRNSIFTLSIWTMPDVEALRRSQKDLLKSDVIWSPGMSYDLLRVQNGNYCHVQVRPRRIVLHPDGTLKFKDPYEFLIKVFETPAHPTYLELINQRVRAWSK